MRVCRVTTNVKSLLTLTAAVLVSAGCASSHASTKSSLDSGVAVIDCEVKHDLPVPKKHGFLNSVANTIGKIENDEMFESGRPAAMYITPAGKRHRVKGKLTKGLAVFEGLSPGTYYVLRVDQGLEAREDADPKIHPSGKHYEVGNIYEFEHKPESGWAESNVSEAKPPGYRPVPNPPPAFEVAAGKATYLRLTIRGVCRRYIVDGEVTNYDPRAGFHLDFDARGGPWASDVDSSSNREATALELLHKHYHKKPWDQMVEERLRALK